MSQKMLPALLALVAAPLLACGSSPADDPSTSSAEALSVLPRCARGAQTNEGGWTGATLLPGDHWFDTGQTSEPLGFWHLYGAYDAATGNIDAYVWVDDSDVSGFEYYDDVCTPGIPRVTPTPTGPSNPKGGPGSNAPWVYFPATCVTQAQAYLGATQDTTCTHSTWTLEK